MHIQYASIIGCDRCGAKAHTTYDLATYTSNPPGWLVRNFSAARQMIVRLIDGTEKGDFCGDCLALPVIEFLNGIPAEATKVR